MKTQFITDNKGTKVGIILSIKEYAKIMEELDDIEDVKLYDKAKKKKADSIPAEEAFATIERKRKK
jgi:hypothetical protein